MSHFGDFMDGVPVKISEKYKRPPRIDLPYSIHECPVRAQSVVNNVKYCPIFETNVLTKLKELRNAKETKKNERKHRLQLLEEAKQKRLDAIAAAEAEEKLKQLSVSEVSYPSTEEISTLSPDDKDKNCDTIPTHDDVPEHDNTALSNDDHLPISSNYTESQLNILQPIQIKSNYQQTSLLDDPDPLQELILSGKVMKMPYNNIDTLTFKDFENDTSSPFDNVELKTINDMEQLAQVLQQRDATTSFHQPLYNMEPTFTTIPNCASEANMGGVMYLPNSNVEQPSQGQGVMFTPQHYPVSNGYYISTEPNCDNAHVDNAGYRLDHYQYYTPINPYSSPNSTYYSNQTNDVIVSNPSYMPPSYYYQQASQYPCTSPYIQPKVEEPNTERDNKPINSQIVKKSRSRSVPDIVKELDEEIQRARQRAAETINIIPDIPVVSQPSCSNKIITSNDKKEHRRRRKEENEKVKLPNPYDKLPLKVQEICKKIHGMGFPLDRVARISTLVGDDDKKIIEGLLLLGDLMDLGFSEGRVSAALAKHDFNKDKALDELVS